MKLLYRYQRSDQAETVAIYDVDDGIDAVPPNDWRYLLAGGTISISRVSDDTPTIDGPITK